MNRSGPAFLCWFALLIPGRAAAADDGAVQPIAQKDALVFSDDFSSDRFGDAWVERIKSAGVENGVMYGRQTTAAHGSVATARLQLPDGNLVFECRVQFEHNATVAFSFDDMSFKGSVAGHIARVTLEERLVKLHDDCDGAMNRELAARRNSADPQIKSAAEKKISEHTRMLPLTLETKRWYSIRIEIAGDQMRLTLDDKPVGWLEASGLAHATKPDLKISVSGKQALFDDLRIWSVKKSASH